MTAEVVPGAGAARQVRADAVMSGHVSGGRGPLPLVIGVTGHRDLRPEDVPHLENRVRNMVADLQRRFPHTPVTLLSPLAEGADQLVARVALALGVRLICPLPLPRDTYVADFRRPEVRAEFDRLLAAADAWFPVPFVADNTPERVSRPGPARDLQYAMVGAVVARQCQLLIALWDGVRTDLVGGTSQTIRYELEGVPEPFAPRRSPLDPVESGPVYHIVTPRQKNPTPDGMPFSVHRRYPRDAADGPHVDTIIERIFQRLDTFNADALRLEPKLAHARHVSKGYLYPEAEFAALMATADPSLPAIRECYAVADTMASHFRDLTTRTLGVLSVLALIVLSMFLTYDKLKPEGAQADPFLEGVIAVSVVALATGYVWYLQANRQDLLNKHLTYRALAEGLRVQFFWRLADLPDAVSDHYLRKQRSELDWIRHAVGVWGSRLRSTHGEVAGLPLPDRLRLVAQYWVLDQARYFTRRAFDADVMLQRLRNAGYVLLFGAMLLSALRVYVDLRTSTNGFDGALIATSLVPIAVALLHAYDKMKKLATHRHVRHGEGATAPKERQRRLRDLRGLEQRFVISLLAVVALLALTLYLAIGPFAEPDHEHNVKAWMAVGVGVLIAGAAILHTYAERRAYSAHANQYSRMRVLFENANRTLDTLLARQRYGEAEDLLRDLGKEALAENGDWVILHRERPLPSPDAA